MQKVKLTVVGLGIGGSIHLQRIRTNSDVVLDSLVAPDRPRNHLIAAREGVPLFHSLDDCIRSRSIDGVIIASPNALHAEHAHACIDACLPALLEKPITANLSDAGSLVARSTRAKAKLLIGHHRAHSLYVKAAADIVSSGHLGAIVSVIGSAQFYKPDLYFKDGDWRTKAGGGPVLINFIHEIDTLRRVIGEIIHVQAYTTNSFRRFCVEDTAAISVRFKNAALGCFMVSDTAATNLSWEQTTRENPTYAYYPDNCFHISGTHGCLALPSMQVKSFRLDEEKSWRTPFSCYQQPIESNDPIAAQLAHFIDIIRQNSAPLVTAEDGYRNLQIALAVLESARSGQSIEVPRL